MLNMELVHYTRILRLANAHCGRTAEGARIRGAKVCHPAGSHPRGPEPRRARGGLSWSSPQDGTQRQPFSLPGPSPANIAFHRAASGRGDCASHAGLRAGLCQDPEHSPGMEIADKRN